MAGAPAEEVEGSEIGISRRLWVEEVCLCSEERGMHRAGGEEDHQNRFSQLE